MLVPKSLTFTPITIPPDTYIYAYTIKWFVKTTLPKPTEYYATITCSPTCNCQSFSIGNIAAIARFPEVLEQTLKHCHQNIMKVQILLDIHNSDLKKTTKTLNKYGTIVLSTPYKNNNHSPMHLCLFKFTNDSLNNGIKNNAKKTPKKQS